MKATELRIGNYVTHIESLDPMEIVNIKKIGGMDIKYLNNKRIFDGYNYDEIDPVLLTEQWLKDFGFEQFSNYKIYNKGDFQIDKTAKEQDESGYWFFINSYPVNVVYVHQLQNLYFALTGRELNK